jgi:RNA polymerase sigma-70 factor (ECF subfamily)
VSLSACATREDFPPRRKPSKHAASTVLQPLSSPPNREESLKGRVLEEEHYEALASRLRCSEAVIRKRVSRGLAELRTRMKEA